MAWKPLTKDNVMGYSALCYFFAKLLYEKTGVPVGIVNSSWGGTPVEAWISEEGLKDYPIYLNQKSLYSSEELMNECMAMAKTIAAKAPLAVRYAKEANY